MFYFYSNKYFSVFHMNFGVDDVADLHWPSRCFLFNIEFKANESGWKNGKNELCELASLANAGRWTHESHSLSNMDTCAGQNPPSIETM